MNQINIFLEIFRSFFSLDTGVCSQMTIKNVVRVHILHSKTLYAQALTARPPTGPLCNCMDRTVI